MDPQLLTLAGDTPLDDLVGLPNGIEITYSVVGDLAHRSFDEQRQILQIIAEMIEVEQTLPRSLPGLSDEDFRTARDAYRDFEWLCDALKFQPLPRLFDGTEVSPQDLYNVLALYKLGEVIAATRGSDYQQFPNSVVENLIESTKAMIKAMVSTKAVEQKSAKLKTKRAEQTREEIIAQARSEAAQAAANIRHKAGRIAKEKAIRLYFEGTFPSVDYASAVIADQVFKAPRTVANWISEAKKKRGES
jgi:hypothetical protein